MKKRAIFAGGCFWCMEELFRKIDGIVDVKCGYTGGEVENPTYEDVKSGKTGHYEAILIEYDSEKVDYKTLLTEFLSNIDPTDGGGQFVDRGTQYRPAIFYTEKSQMETAKEFLEKLSRAKIFKGVIAVKILPEKKFYEAEKYHQEYFRTCPLNYKLYKNSSGRVDYVKKFKNEIKKILEKKNG